MKEVKEKCDRRLIHLDVSKILFETLMQKYERVTVDFITNEMVSNTGLAQHYFALSKNEKIGKKALGCFVRDPLQADETMNQ